MHLCSLSITYACPHHNPTATMGHSIQNVDISKPLNHTTLYTLSAICPVQWKPGFIREENTSPKCQTPSNVSICPLNSITTTNCSQVETLMWMTSMQLSFPKMVSDSFCRNYLVMQTDCCSSCPGGWSQTILEVKMLNVEVLGWCGYTWSTVVRPVECTDKFSETPLEMTYGREMTISPFFLLGSQRRWSLSLLVLTLIFPALLPCLVRDSLCTALQTKILWINWSLNAIDTIETWVSGNLTALTERSQPAIRWRVGEVANRVSCGSFSGGHWYLPIRNHDNRYFADWIRLYPGLSKNSENGNSCPKPHKAARMIEAVGRAVSIEHWDYNRNMDSTKEKFTALQREID